MFSKIVVIAAFSGLFTLGGATAYAADGRDTSLTPVVANQATVIEGRNVSADLAVTANENAAIRSQLIGNARSSH